MIKIGYLYQGEREYIKELAKYDLTFVINDERYVKELIEYNLPIKMMKYLNDYYDVFVSETDDLKNIIATKKVVIGNFKNKKNKIKYIEEFNIEKILEKPQKEDYKFSVIVPNYNNAEWIGKTIESVINQNYKNWEMYIIDDMSTDNSIEVVEKYKDDRITLIKNEIKLYNGGSRNMGILRAKKSNPDGYLLFIDSDDWLANDNVMKSLNNFIEDEDLITLDYQYYLDNKVQGRGTHVYSNIDDLFMTQGAMCAVWCKCFKVSIAPLFEFNTLMEDRNYHYRLVNRINSYANFGQVTHTWNKMNYKSVTTVKQQKYKSELQSTIEWNNCAYRHIAGMLDLLNELSKPSYINFIKQKIDACKNKVNKGVYEQY